MSAKLSAAPVVMYEFFAVLVDVATDTEDGEYEGAKSI
jgi:hypothetical protein